MRHGFHASGASLGQCFKTTPQSFESSMSLWLSARTRSSACSCSRAPEAEARRFGHDNVYLYTNELMAENIALYARSGYAEYERRQEQGFRRVFMRKSLRSEGDA